MRLVSRINLGRITLVGAVVASLVLAGFVSSGNAQSKVPTLYKGNGYRVEPGLMYGWDPDGVGRPIRYLGKIHASDPAGSAIRWSTWGRQRAIGVGLARSSGCSEGGKPGNCELGYPWNGTKLRVVAWRPKNGHFTRLKMSTRVSRSSNHFYELVLAFRGPFVPNKTVSWRTLRTTRS